MTTPLTPNLLKRLHWENGQPVVKYNSFQEFFDGYRNDPIFTKLYRWIYKNITMDNAHNRFDIRTEGYEADEQMAYIFHQMTQMGDRTSVCTRNAFLIGQLFGEGPKIFQIPRAACEAFAEMEVNLSFEDYNQPYDTCVVEFPRDYAQSLRIEMPSDTLDPFTPGERQRHYPLFCIINCLKDRQGIMVGVYFASDRYVNMGMQADGLIEDRLEERCRPEAFKNTGDMLSIEEGDVLTWAARIALNALLTADGEGFHTLSPFSGKRRELTKKLEKLKAIRKRNPVQQKAIHQVQDDLKECATYFSLDQHIVFYSDLEEESSMPSSGGPVQEPKRPHWRRGHWRMQPHGPQHSLRKRIRIKPIRVNWHLYKGQPEDTKATYTVKGSSA